VRILIVDDEPQMAEALRRGLEREGYTTMLADDGQKALHLARTVDHDLMILDWMLPKVDGREVARRLRESGVRTPILMLTARDRPPDVVEGLDGGADDYLTKPFAFEILLARLRALARRVPDTRQPELKVHDLVLDPASRTVRRSGREIHLSAREFRLLHYLMQRAGEVVRRHTLIEAAWGYEAAIESNTLDAFIHLLRAKLEQPPQPKLIHTVRGVGYCLRETP
jgi:DNA-binding response OmpR family regulator